MENNTENEVHTYQIEDTVVTVEGELNIKVYAKSMLNFIDTYY